MGGGLGTPLELLELQLRPFRSSIVYACFNGLDNLALPTAKELRFSSPLRSIGAALINVQSKSKTLKIQKVASMKKTEFINIGMLCQ
jgi:hypothetical protein